MKEKSKFYKWWENYWYHYKWHTLGGLFVIFLISITIFDMTSNVKSDIDIALVSPKYLDVQTLNSMEEELEKISGDYNGDGEVNVSVFHYQLDYSENADPNTLMASTTKLYGDMASKSNMIFIIDDINYYRGVFIGLIKDSNGNFIEEVEEGEVIVPVDEELFGFPLNEVSIFADVSYYENISLFDELGNSRVVLADESYVGNNKEAQEIYNNSKELYEKLK